jgi:hypothetical protein
MSKPSGSPGIGRVEKHITSIREMAAAMSAGGANVSIAKLKEYAVAMNALFKFMQTRIIGIAVTDAARGQQLDLILRP